MDKWAKRRRNLKALMAIKDKKPSPLAVEAGMSVNTLNKFLRGESKTMRWSTLENVCTALGLPNATILDADNPFSDSKSELYEIINDLSEEDAKQLLSHVKSLSS